MSGQGGPPHMPSCRHYGWPEADEDARSCGGACPCQRLALGLTDLAKPSSRQILQEQGAGHEERQRGKIRVEGSWLRNALLGWCWQQWRGLVWS